MSKFIIGQKVGMTRAIKDGVETPLTVVLAMPNTVVKCMDSHKDGYNAVLIGAGASKRKKLNMPQAGSFKKSKSSPQIIKEFAVDDISQYNVGDKINLDNFSAGDKVNITGRSKGKGFSGVIKRHSFHRGPESHGSDHHRAPGSIGGGYPQRVVKGKKMPGHLGNKISVQKNSEIFDVLPEENIVLLYGSVAGPNKSWVFIEKIK